MNPLVKKEIRLLLPGWLAILVLEVSLPWLLRDPFATSGWIPLLVFFGMILVALDSFGREFSLGTFQSLLAQPIERRKIWRIKLTVLFFAAALIFIGCFISYKLLLYHTFKGGVNPTLSGSDFRNTMFVSIAAILVALIGGLWTTLLFRQISAAFWIAFLTPAGLLMLITFVMSTFFESASDAIVSRIVYGAAGLYVISGFWLAHRLFHRAQDAAWTGGVISFSKWRYFDTGARSSVSVRRRQPLAALLTKEFQLHSLSLIGLGVLLILHLTVFFLRAFYSNFHRDSLVCLVTDSFWLLWLVIPVVIGCMAVAEERKLGVTETQFCLPVSRRFQFAAKFIPVMIFGTLLGGILPVLLEMAASHLGAPSYIFKPESHGGNGIFDISSLGLFETGIIALAAGLALISFFASTLARNFLQALSITIVTVVGCMLFFNFIIAAQSSVYGGKLWGLFLPLIIGMGTAIVLIPCRAYCNFSHLVENGRLWQRNIVGVIGAVAFVFASSAAIFNRAWEIAEPAEPPHGPAVFSSAYQPKLRCDAPTSLQVQLPDGRIWFNSLGHSFLYDDPQWQELWWLLFQPLPVSAGPQQFMAGSNWVSATTYYVQFANPAGGPKRVNGYLDTVGVQADGTLWISSEAKPGAWTGTRMIRFGDETNWQQVARQGIGLVLLKRDGTLWQWGTNNWDWKQWQTHWPTVRVSKPQQIGTNSDWQEIFICWNKCLVRKNDGSVWRVNWDWKIEPESNLDKIVLETFSGSWNDTIAYIGKDGTLWDKDRFFDESKNSWEGTGKFLQVGKETNWVATARTSTWMLALKSDGSLWQWRYAGNFPEEVAKITPSRLGIHQDWIGLTVNWDGVVTLAADGSLWFWPNPERDVRTLLKGPKQPQLLGNVFDRQN
jgi:ABC-type transport system involved in multi-copper enzyme maturation permease subunit